MYIPCLPDFSGLALVNNSLSFNKELFDYTSVKQLIATSKTLTPHDVTYYRAKYCIQSHNLIRLRELLDLGCPTETLYEDPYQEEEDKEITLFDYVLDSYDWDDNSQKDEVTDILLEYVPWRTDEECLSIYLKWCSKYSHFSKTVTKLLQMGAKPNFDCIADSTPEMLKIILETNPQGAYDLVNLEMYNYTRKTPLQYCLNNWNNYSKSSQEKAELLIEAGTNLNHQDKDGKTALMLLASNAHNCPSLLKLMLEKGADKNIRDKNGYTVFQYARVNRKSSEEYLSILSL